MSDPMFWRGCANSSPERKGNPKTQNMGYGTKARTVGCRDPGNGITVIIEPK